MEIIWSLALLAFLVALSIFIVAIISCIKNYKYEHRPLSDDEIKILISLADSKSKIIDIMNKHMSDKTVEDRIKWLKEKFEFIPNDTKTYSAIIDCIYVNIRDIEEDFYYG